MKFEDLQFDSHPNALGGTHARHMFPNGYGVSVITGSMFYCNESGPYEVAVLCGNEDEWFLTYDTPITSDVLGYQTQEEVQAVMDRVAELPQYVEEADVED